MPRGMTRSQTISNLAGHSVVNVPYCSPAGKVLTVAVHAAWTGCVFGLMSWASHGLGDYALQLCAAHCGILLGVWGPRAGRSRYWWVPDNAHEQLGSA